ncbi:MAG: polymer-forming cytoskeletal protein [Candidatus Zixiibacteriota bacterium]|nr:MAG: polymer-forming cytoskeletal protein [candidate division Zixibacteria bacterium]
MSKNEGGMMNTIIGKDAAFTGTLDVKGSVRVDGTIKGKIVCSDTVTVGSGGYVEADIEAETTVVVGKMVGNINAAEKIELQAKSDVEGDIRTKSLVVEQGAVFCGACQMKEGRSNLGFIPPEAKDDAKADKDKVEEEIKS